MIPLIVYMCDCVCLLKIWIFSVRICVSLHVCEHTLMWNVLGENWGLFKSSVQLNRTPGWSAIPLISWTVSVVGGVCVCVCVLEDKGQYQCYNCADTYCCKVLLNECRTL